MPFRYALPLLLVEYLVLSLAIDARDLLAGLGVASLGALGMVGPFVVCTGAAFAVLGGRRLRAVLRDETPPDALAIARIAITIHTLAYLAFLALSIAIARRTPRASIDRPTALLWIVTTLAVATSFVRLAVPPRARAWAKTEGRAAIAASIAVGLVATLAGTFAWALWPMLATATLYASAALLSPAGGHLVLDPSGPDLGLDSFVVHVAPVCSGIEGIALMLVLVTTYLVVFRRALRFPRALVLLPIGVVAAFVANCMRIAGLVYVGARVSQALALGAFHSKAGWVAFSAMGLALLALARRSMEIESSAPAALVRGPVARYVLPELAVIAIALLTGLFAEDVDRLYALRILGGALLLAIVPIPWWRGGVDRRAIGRALLAGIVAWGAWRLLAYEPFHVEATERYLATASHAGRFAYFASRVVGSVLVVPIVEELAFRGFLLRFVDARAFDEVDPRTVSVRALVVSSLVFGLLHTSALAGFAAGLVYGALYRSTGRLRDAMLAHSVTNGIIAFEVIVLGRLGSW